MSTVVADVSMSLDGYITGPEPSTRSGLGRSGDALHQWAFAQDSPRDHQLLEESGARTDAAVMVRNTFDFVDGPNGWNDDIGYAYDHAPSSRSPIFVVTHQTPTSSRLEGFSFVTEGVRAAVEAAREAAGEDEAVIMGGASVIDQALTAGLVEVLRIHLSPALLGAGTRLFDLIEAPILLHQADALVTPHATHLTYRLQKD